MQNVLTQQETYHDRKHDADLLNDFKDAQQQEEDHLVEGVGVDTEVGDSAKIAVVWLVFVWDEWQCQTLNKLREEGEEREGGGGRGREGGGGREGKGVSRRYRNERWEGGREREISESSTHTQLESIYMYTSVNFRSN